MKKFYCIQKIEKIEKDDHRFDDIFEEGGTDWEAEGMFDKLNKDKYYHFFNTTDHNKVKQGIKGYMFDSLYDLNEKASHYFKAFESDNEYEKGKW